MKLKRIFPILAFLVFIIGFPVFAQSTSVPTPTVPEEKRFATRQTSNTGAPEEGAAPSRQTPAGGVYPGADAVADVQLARSSADYRVTPGDVYTLAYAAGSAPVSYTVAVDASYRIRVSNLGIINGAGKTFMQLKSEAEAVVARNYPLSGAQLVLTQPAVFRVHVTGEVEQSGEIPAWGLSRLSSLLAGGRLTAYASTRDITVTSLDGQVKAYDLFKAQRGGDLGQDPYLRPGDEVRFKRAERTVEVSGEVERPGRYQLLAGENLGELVGRYGGGLTARADRARATLTRYTGSAEISGDIILLGAGELTGGRELRDLDAVHVPRISERRPAVAANLKERTVSITGAVRRPGTYELLEGENLGELVEAYAGGYTAAADLTRLEIVRLVNGGDESGEKLFLSGAEASGGYALEHYDAVTVPSRSQLRPVMFVEGAIAAGAGYEAGAELAAANRAVVQYAPGESYASLVRARSSWFTAVSDTRNAYIERGGVRIAVNLNPMLYDASYRGEVLVEANDVLVIPFRQYFVTVAGAVVKPGRYPYIPDRDWEYYVGLAGGFAPERNYGGAVEIRDAGGKPQPKSAGISPETVITARTNFALYYINQWAPVVTAFLSALSTIFSLYLVTR